MSFEFTARKGDIARLVRSVASDPTAWTPLTEQRLSEHYGHRRFLCDGDILKSLRGRADGIHRMLRTIGYFKNDTLNKDEDNQFSGGDLGALINFKPTTLRRIVKIDAALKFLSSHDDAAVRDAAVVGGRSFTLPDDCVVPALYHADPVRWKVFRERILRVGRTDASRLIWGNSGSAPDYFYHFELGSQRQRNVLDYRVTKVTAQWIYDRLQAHCTAADIDCPNFEYFFDDKPTSGRGNGDHTEPLMVSLGNRLA